MPKAYDKIPTVTLLAKSQFVQAPKTPMITHLNDPALTMMINLEHTPAETISIHDHITDAILIEKASTDHVLFVTDDHHNIIGILTAEDVHGEKSYQIMQDKRIKRSDISVKMVMTPFDQVLCLESENLLYAKVSNVIVTLIESKQHYALVVDKSANGSAYLVKGFFWASLIGQALGSDITSTDVGAQSIAELQREFPL